MYNTNKPYKRNTQPTPEMQYSDIQRVVDHLGHAFAIATKDMGRAARVVSPGTTNLVPNELYKLQVRFSYMINDIMRGPRYIAPKIITECNEFIASINK
jgi:hypothetical protein